MLNNENNIKFPKNLGQEIVLLRHNNLVDVFYGNDGWGPHARFATHRTQKGVYVKQLTEDKIPAYVFQHVIKEVNNG